MSTQRPDLPYGYYVCQYTPANVTATGEAEGVLEQSFADYKVREYVGDDDDFLYYKFTALDGTDTFWAWPIEVDCSSSGASKPATSSSLSDKVKQVQKALNTKYPKHQYYPLVVDGKWGPKTCYAAYGYQKDVVGYSGGTLIGDFFVKLGLPEVWKTTFQNSCLGHHGDQPAPPPPPEPVVEEKPFPWATTALGAVAGSLVGLAGKKTVLKKTKVKTWQAGVGGALVGALGGFVAGKLRQ